MTFKLRASIASITALLFLPAAYACSCMGFDSADEQIASADLVFEGEVINVALQKDDRPFWRRLFSRPAMQRHITTFHVYRAFKGEPDNTVAVVHLGGEHGATCGVDFPQNQPSVILAYRRADGSFGSSLCTRAQFDVEAFERAAGFVPEN